MAGQIGIKTNLSIDRTKLDAEIKRIQKTLESQDALKIRLSVNQDGIKQLEELKTLVKDITSMAGKGIKIKVDHYKMKEAEETSSSDIAAKEAEKVAKAQEEALKAEEAATQARIENNKRNEIELQKSLSKRYQLQKESEKHINDVLRQEVQVYKSNYDEIIKYTLDYGKDGATTLTKDKTIDHQAEINIMKKLQTEVDKTRKKYEDLQKKSGYSNPSQMGVLTKNMNSLGKVFNINTVEKTIAKIEQLNTEFDKVGKTVNDKMGRLDATKKINASVKSLTELKSKFADIKEAYPDFDKDGSVARSLEVAETKLANIQKLGAKAGKNAFTEMAIDIETAKNGVNGLEANLKKVTDKEKLISRLGDKIDDLFKFDSVSTTTIEKFRTELESISKLDNKFEMAKQADELEKKLRQTSKGAQDAEKAMRGLGNTSHGIKKLSDGLAKIGIYFSAWRITSEIFQEIKRGIGVVAELDNQIVQVGIDMNVTAEESKSLIQNAQRIASETGIAIDEIVRVAGVYSNATESMDSVLAKVKPSAILAGVAGANATEITDMFQGVVNQYKLAKDDIEAISYQISDSIIAVAKNMSQNFDTSVKEISDVMLDAGAVMNELGYTYQETMAMAGAIMEVTRQSGSELGGAMRMIGARIGGAKNTGEDVDVEEISNAAKAYKAIGIEIVDTEGNFKDMKDTINELSQVWGSLTDVERSYIAEMSAGNRRRNTFMVMMDTMGKQTDLTSEALNSQGTTLEANAKYMESTQAKMQNFTNAMDTLWQNAISSDGIKNILELATGFVKIADSIGAVNVALISFGVIMSVTGKMSSLFRPFEEIFTSMIANTMLARAGMETLAGSTIRASFATLKLTAAQLALKAAMGVVFGLAIAVVVGAIAKLISSYESAEDRAKRFSEAVSESTNTIQEASRIQKEIKVVEFKIGKSKDETERVGLQEELLTLQKEMAKVLPQTTTMYTEEGEAIAGNNEVIQEQIDLQRILRQDKAKDWLDNNGLSENNLKKRQEEIDQLKEQMAMFEEMRKNGQTTYGERTVRDGDGLKTVSLDVAEEEAKVRERINEMNLESVDINAMINATGEERLKKLGQEVIAVGSTNNGIENINSNVEETGDLFGVVVRKVEELDDAISESVGNMQDLQGIIDEIDDKDFDGISEGSVMTIIEKFPELIQFMNDEKVLKEKALEMYDKEKKLSNEALAVKLANLGAEGKAHFNVMNQKVANDAEWYTVNVKNNIELVKTFKDLYGIDLRNWNTLLEAKNASDRRYIATTSSNFSSMFGSIAAGYNQIIDAAYKTQDEANKALGRYGKNMLIESDYNGGAPRGKVIYRGIGVTTSAFNGVSWSGVNPSTGTGSGSASGSDKDKTVYESDEVFFNKHIALVEEYQRQLENLENKISKTQENIAYYREIGSDSALQNALNLQNTLYGQQAEKVKLLAKAQADLKKEQNTIASSMSGLGINMSTQTNEDMNYWLDKLYPQVKSTSQSVIDAQNAKREAFKVSWEAYMSYASELVSIESELLGLQTGLLETLKEKYEIEFEIVERRLEKISQITDEVNKKLALLDGSASYNQKESLTSEALDSLINYKSELETTIRTLVQQRDKLETNSAEWVIINEQVKEYQDMLHETNVEILDTQNNLKALRDEEFNNSMSLLDKIATGVRKQYEEAKKAELAALKATLDAEVGNKRKELEILQDRLDAMNDTTADKEAELKALREEAKMWEGDNSVFAKRQLAELEQLIKDKERELEKDKIQNEMDNLEEEIETIEEANQEKVDAVNETYDELLADQNVYQQASRILMTSSQDEILAFLLQYDEKYKSMGSVLGAAFATGLMEEIAKGLDSFEALSDGLLGSGSIPWLSTLPSGYSYDASGGVKANAIGASSVSSLSSDANFDSVDYATLRKMIDYNSLATQIENANVEMNVNFYTNGQLDVDRSIKSLGDMLKGSLAGSGTMLNINK